MKPWMWTALFIAVTYIVLVGLLHAPSAERRNQWRKPRRHPDN